MLEGKAKEEKEEFYSLEQAVEMAKELIKKGKKATEASKENFSL